MKIIVFTHAGGNKYSYNNFYKNYDRFIVIEYNGRGTRIDKPFVDNIYLLVDEVYERVSSQDLLSEDYIIYGHSLGALVGYLLCQKIMDKGGNYPKKLVLSGKKHFHRDNRKNISTLPDSEFWKEVTALGGIPDEMMNYPELIDFYIPILRNDFKLVESFQHKPQAKLTFPIDIFYGSEEACDEDMQGWLDESTEKVTITKLTGNHFFIFKHTEFFNTYFDSLMLKK
ncbi:thioesterase II family protein [Chryseobacterium gallinarum]|uniref:Thioesterase n=1 Tax=Chryseobacterium gallinarum TaxID=1324352 RepID=A0ABX6KRI8_CHRGL|nr:thioesterase [Chryseobacterium gallinarum]MCL8537187.1 thioesterase domain-containing protein [Chryseobacterium gallinarum]QIY90731.1 thioesterase [Chryseobacterium gallinarum]